MALPHPKSILLTIALLEMIVPSLMVWYRAMDVVESTKIMAPRPGGSISSARDNAVTSPVLLSVSSNPHLEWKGSHLYQ